MFFAVRAMAMNHVQLQLGLSFLAFSKQYGSNQQCEQAFKAMHRPCGFRSYRALRLAPTLPTRIGCTSAERRWAMATGPTTTIALILLWQGYNRETEAEPRGLILLPANPKSARLTLLDIVRSRCGSQLQLYYKNVQQKHVFRQARSTALAI